MHEAFVEDDQALTLGLQVVRSQPPPPPTPPPPAAGQIISKSCNFSPETEFTQIILA